MDLESTFSPKAHPPRRRRRTLSAEQQRKANRTSVKAPRETPLQEQPQTLELPPAQPARREEGEEAVARLPGSGTGGSTFLDLVADLVACYDDEVSQLRTKINKLEEVDAKHEQIQKLEEVDAKHEQAGSGNGNGNGVCSIPEEVALVTAPVPLQRVDSKKSLTFELESQDSGLDLVGVRLSENVSALMSEALSDGSAAMPNGYESGQSGAEIGRCATVATKSWKIGNIDLERDEPLTGMLWFLKGPMDIIMSIVIVLNAGTLFANFQFTGMQLGHEIGFLPVDPTWPHYPIFFFVVEHVFQAIYVIELTLRITFQRRSYFFVEDSLEPQKFNWLDVVIVLMGCLDLYILPLMGNADNSSWAFARLIRIARLARSLKIVRVLKVFSQLRVLVSTIASSMFALFWSMVLLFILMVMGACCILQMVQSDLLDGVERGVMTEDMRLEIYIQFGTAFKALWSFFEMTLGGQGTSLARPLVELHWLYGILVISYVSVVAFAIICIIEALFLKDTLRMAANDADMMVQQQLDTKKQLSARIQDLFRAADTSGDGLVSREEFEEIMGIPKVKAFFEMMELEVEEINSLFSLLDPGTGCIAYHDFVSGIFRLKGQARSMDVITVMLDCKKMVATLRDIERHIADPMSERDAMEDLPRPSARRLSRVATE